MNITFEGAETSSARVHTNVGRETTSYSTPKSTGKVEASGFALDISGTVMDNGAYAGHGRTAEEVMLEAGQVDVTAQRNYMAVMSNTMSDEDFARLQKEGFHPGSTDIETVVTIVDHIKAALLKGGTQVSGYTDDMDADTLGELTGSRAFAEELKNQFVKKDIPLTEENINAVMKAWDMLSEAEAPSEGGVKYMVENGMAPTPENIYTANYSAAGTERQGRGYYAEGGVAGYYARKPEEADFEKLRPQMEKVIEEAGYQADEENLEKAKWLIEKGIPLNADTFSLLSNIREQQFPVSWGDFVSAAACAIADGVMPAKAVLGRETTYVEEAVKWVEQTGSIEAETADIIMARDLPLTLKNLLAAAGEMLYGKGEAVQKESLPENLRGRRLLEEIRLSMTVEANIHLLRRGYQIETAPLEELVVKLREAETSYEMALTREVDHSEAEKKASLYEETVQTLEGIRSAPAAVVSRISEEDRLPEVYAYGTERKLDYEKAGQTYEALMTAPRRDMGDTIQKAFRNVDDILKDLELELSDENRRAVRILGYNSLEITEENIRQVREKDELLCNVVREMKPGRVLRMIREGVNPLNMSLKELENYLQDQKNPAEEMESYSRFLYKLEQQKNITEEERSAYIGIYRLVHQIEKADDASVGMLWQTGAEYTLGNLLSALRSSRRGSMDYTVDDRFGGVNARDTGKESITDQILKGYPEGVLPNRQELAELLEDAGDGSAGEEFDHMLYEQARMAAKSEEAVLKELKDYEQPLTTDHLLAAGALLRNPKEIWQELNRLKKQGKTPESNGEKESFLEDAGAEVMDAFDSRENAGRAYEGLQEKLQEAVENMAFSHNYEALDVKAMSVLYKQISFMGRMAKEENYEIPADIGGRLTSINLKIIHNDSGESKVAITFASETLGKTAAEFKMTDQGLSGFCISDTRDGSRLLKEHKELFEERLSREQVEAGEIYFAVGENLDLVDFTLKETENRQSGNDSQMLYRTAKAFIGYVQEIEMEKGN